MKVKTKRNESSNECGPPDKLTGCSPCIWTLQCLGTSEEFHMNGIAEKAISSKNPDSVKERKWRDP